MAADLVLHQGDEGRDHDREAAQHEGGYLKADGLAAAGRQHGERVSALQHRVDDRRLGRTEVRIAEVMLEEPARFHHGIVHGESFLVCRVGSYPSARLTGPAGAVRSAVE
jgi:hypothetical protein